jgi:hypothetical protein
MKNYKIGVFVTLLCFSLASFAGNEDRAGEAGASELLINPWGRSSGWGSANSASAKSIEAMNLNVAGLAYTNGTEIMYTNTSWLGGTDISINAVGLAKQVGEGGGVLGITIMSMSFGDIGVTTVNNPDGGLGEFSPNYLNIAGAYSKKFSNTISGGIAFRLLSESISNVKVSGVSIDAGVNYVTGENDNLKFGIALRNVGPTASFEGNGLSDRLTVEDSEKDLTVNQRSSDFELPSLLNIGLSYDFYLMTDSSSTSSEHRLTAAGTFTSNSFTSDQVRLGIEYGFKEMFMVRTGYVYEKDVTDEELTKTAATGFSFGASIEVPVNKNGSKLGIDYSYRSTRIFDGHNSIGLRISF